MAERPSKAALRRWVERQGNTQTALAGACGVAQGTIWRLAYKAGEVPSDGLAELLEIATGGEVSAGGWATEPERKRAADERAAALARARSFASGGAHVNEPTDRKRVRKAGRSFSGSP